MKFIWVNEMISFLNHFNKFHGKIYDIFSYV